MDRRMRLIRALGPLLLARVATAAGAYSWTPFLVVHLMTQSYSAMAASAVLTAATVTSSAAAPAAGYLSDQMPVRRLILISTLVSAGGLFALALGASITWLAYAAALLMGLASAVASVSFRSAVAYLVPESDLPEAYSLLHSGMNIGGVLGPGVVGLAVSRQQYGVAIATAGGLYLLAATAILFTAGRWRTGVEPARLGTGGQPQAAADEGPRLPERASPPRGQLVAYLALVLLEYTLLQQLFVGFAKYNAAHFQKPGGTAGWLMLQAVLAAALVPLAGSRMKGWSVARLFAVYTGGLLCISIGFVAFGLFPPGAVLPAMALLLVATVLGEMLSIPATGALAVQVSAAKRHGTTFGLTDAVRALGRAAGASGGGLLLSYTVERLPGFWLVGGTGMAAVIGVVGGAGWWLARRTATRMERGRVPAALP